MHSSTIQFYWVKVILNPTNSQSDDAKQPQLLGSLRLLFVGEAFLHTVLIVEGSTTAPVFKYWHCGPKEKVYILGAVEISLRFVKLNQLLVDFHIATSGYTCCERTVICSSSSPSKLFVFFFLNQQYCNSQHSLLQEIKTVRVLGNHCWRGERSIFLCAGVPISGDTMMQLVCHQSCFSIKRMRAERDELYSLYVQFA